MKIDPIPVSVSDLTNGYTDDGEGGIRGFGGSLDIRPAYQREFVYRDEQRDAVIETLREGLPLNSMYWADIGNDRYEIIDGQQRTVSICQYVSGKYSIDGLAFHNLQRDEQEKILNYELSVYVCQGTASERLKWFRTINIAGAVLTNQELRNAVYHGLWVSDAKRYFSHTGCPASEIGGNYLKGSAIRQEYLEAALKWKSDDDIESYMSKHQHDNSAVALWNHFRSVIDWVEATFTKYRKEMKGVDWGALYNRFRDQDLNSKEIEARISQLFMDDDVTRKAGVYPFVLDGDERHLNIRRFSDAMKLEAYEEQNGECPICKEEFDISDMEGDHITPWSKGGKTKADNCMMLCVSCNRAKSDK